LEGVTFDGDASKARDVGNEVNKSSEHFRKLGKASYII